MPRGAPTTAPQRGQHALPLVLGHSLVLAFLAILGLESLAQVVFFFFLSFSANSSYVLSFCQQSIIARMVSIIALLEPRLALPPDLECSPVLAMLAIMALAPHALVSGSCPHNNVNRSKNVLQ